MCKYILNIVIHPLLNYFRMYKIISSDASFQESDIDMFNLHVGESGIYFFNPDDVVELYRKHPRLVNNLIDGLRKKVIKLQHDQLQSMELVRECLQKQLKYAQSIHDVYHNELLQYDLVYYMRRIDDIRKQNWLEMFNNVLKEMKML